MRYAEMAMAVIDLKNLTRWYGSRRGVEELNLTVTEGSLFGFLGPNGAGKTTTIRVMLGFLRPSSGQARIFDLDCWRDTRRIKFDVGYVPGDLRLYPWLNGRSALHILGAIRGRDLMRAGLELAERFELDMSAKVRAMSRGMRQKLGLILAMAHEPRVLVMDEPTASLDPLMQVQLHDHVRTLSRKGHTIFFSSHSLSEVEQLCDRVAIVREGRLVANSTLEELRRRAGRQVTIRWKDAQHAATVEPPSSLLIDHRDANQWSGMLAGDVNEFIAWLARHPIEDLTIGSPDLENLFRRYYQEPS
jgi:ABC-2 type transport system ATP-binding protein